MQNQHLLPAVSTEGIVVEKQRYQFYLDNDNSRVWFLDADNLFDAVVKLYKEIGHPTIAGKPPFWTMRVIVWEGSTREEPAPAPAPEPYIEGSPPVKTTDEEYVRMLRRVMKDNPELNLAQVAEKIDKPVEYLQGLLDKHPT